MNITTENSYTEIENALHSLSIPSRPSKPYPAPNSRSSAAEHREYANRLESWEAERTIHQKHVADYKAQYEALIDVWQKKLREEYSNLNDATYALVYSMSYEDGHSSGLSNVRAYMDDNAELAEKIIAANKG